MNRVKWTQEMDRRACDMAAAGKSAAEIAAALFVKKEQVYSRLAYLKQKGHVIGGADGKGMPRMAQPSPSHDAQKTGKESATEAGQLGDLEAAMAETICELTAERDGLAERLAVYEKDYAALLEKNEACLSQIAEGVQEVERLRGEIKDSGEALTRTEEQLDAAMAEAAAHLAKVAEQVKTISSLEARVSGLENDLLAKDLELGKLRDKLDERDGEIDELSGRLERAADKAGQLLTQCLMMGD